jgi:hypothetical protein
MQVLGRPTRFNTGCLCGRGLFNTRAWLRTSERAHRSHHTSELDERPNFRACGDLFVAMLSGRLLHRIALLVLVLQGVALCRASSSSSSSSSSNSAARSARLFAYSNKGKVAPDGGSRSGPQLHHDESCTQPSPRPSARAAARRRNALFYKWQARVERSTGIASSFESSLVPPSSSLGQLLGTTSRRHDWRRATKAWFGQYPVWLCRGRTSFGLLRAVPSSNRNGGYDVVTRRWLGGVTLLSLDRPKVAVISGPELNGRCYTVSLPIVGGLLAVRHEGSKSASLGSLCFSLEIRGDHRRAPDEIKGRLITFIQAYRARMCGPVVPTHPLRARLYLSTQSLVHAYVMWRYHWYCCQQFGSNFYE